MSYASRIASRENSLTVRIRAASLHVRATVSRNCDRRTQ